MWGCKRRHIYQLNKLIWETENEHCGYYLIDYRYLSTFQIMQPNLDAISSQ